MFGAAYNVIVLVWQNRFFFLYSRMNGVNVRNSNNCVTQPYSYSSVRITNGEKKNVHTVVFGAPPLQQQQQQHK